MCLAKSKMVLLEYKTKKSYMVRKGDRNIKIQAGETGHHGYQTDKK